MANAGLLNPFGNGGQLAQSSTYKNFDKDFYLSPADMGTSVFIKNANGYRVRLPDARQLSTKRIVTISNVTDSYIDILNNNGEILKSIRKSATMICWCTNVTTSSGVWTFSINGTALFDNIVLNATNTTIPSVSGSFMSTICVLSDTLAVSVYGQYASPWNHIATPIVLNGSTITLGTQTTILGGTLSNVSYPYDICALSTSTALYVYQNSDNTVRAIVLTVTSTTVSAGSSVAVDSTANCWPSVCAISSSRAVIALRNGVPNLVAYHLSISGNVITVGSAGSVSGNYAIGHHRSSLCGLNLSATNPTLVFVASNVTPAGRYYSVITVTTSTQTCTIAPYVSSVNTDGTNYCVIRRISSTSAIAFYISTASNHCYDVISVSGTTVTIVAENVLIASGSGNYLDVVVLTGTSFFVTTQSKAYNVTTSNNFTSATVKTINQNATLQYVFASSVNPNFVLVGGVVGFPNSVVQIGYISVS